jgi:capsular polysaccharide biosynthesis protein
VWDNATLPDVDRPVKPILWLYTLLAAIVGLLLGTGWAFLADSYNHTVETTDQAERFFGKTVLATVPDVSGGIIKK